MQGRHGSNFRCGNAPVSTISYYLRILYLSSPHEIVFKYTWLTGKLLLFGIKVMKCQLLKRTDQLLSDRSDQLTSVTVSWYVPAHLCTDVTSAASVQVLSLSIWRWQMIKLDSSTCTAAVICSLQSNITGCAFQTNLDNYCNLKARKIRLRKPKHVPQSIRLVITNYILVRVHFGFP